jgi:predicted CXXCH cytochrome family protein
VGTDLAGHHPISFTYDSALVTAKGELRNPQTFQREVRLDKGQQLQCTSCHDPHNDQYGQFLVEDNAGSALCLECHIPKQWNTSSHATSRADWNGVGRNPWPHTNRKTVAANGCENCHTPHQAGTKPQLLNLAPVEENCFNCHNGNVAAKDIRKEFDKPSAHPVAATSSLHVATEDPVYGPRHTSCVDCHNPHATQSSPPSGLHASGSLVAVKGMNSAGRTVQTISQESELCYRCHAESLGRGPSPIRRQLVATNLRLQFQPANASFHPIETAGKSSFVPSLIAPLTTASLITCTDCHNNNQGPGAGGTGPRGPHGSSFPPLLERQLILTDMTPESSASYALCYKCHSRDSILGDESFKATNSQGQPRGHRYHIVDRQTACTTCHQPHGVQLQAHLINFNTQYVSASSNGRLEYVSHGPSGGTCSLTCHVAGGSYDHPATTYPITASSFLRKARPGNRGQ